MKQKTRRKRRDGIVEDEGRREKLGKKKRETLRQAKLGCRRRTRRQRRRRRTGKRKQTHFLQKKKQKTTYYDSGATAVTLTTAVFGPQVTTRFFFTPVNANNPPLIDLFSFSFFSFFRVQLNSSARLDTTRRFFFIFFFLFFLIATFLSRASSGVLVLRCCSVSRRVRFSSGSANQIRRRQTNPHSHHGRDQHSHHRREILQKKKEIRPRRESRETRKKNHPKKRKKSHKTKCQRAQCL